jgi:hypothetical protein
MKLSASQCAIVKFDSSVSNVGKPVCENVLAGDWMKTLSTLHCNIPS